MQPAKKALLIINGTPPKTLPNLEDYALFACTDGAFHHLKKMQFPLSKLDFISGDFDSYTGKDDEIFEEKFIFTPDQNKTDFHKALEIILEKQIVAVDVLGGSGREMDHFLGNISVAYTFFDKMEIRFFDEFASYFFIPKQFQIDNAKGKTISLYPFPVAKKITTRGLKWALNDENLDITSRIGTRNIAIENTVSISFSEGALLIFIAH